MLKHLSLVALSMSVILCAATVLAELMVESEFDFAVLPMAVAGPEPLVFKRWPAWNYYLVPTLSQALAMEQQQPVMASMA